MYGRKNTHIPKIAFLLWRNFLTSYEQSGYVPILYIICVVANVLGSSSVDNTVVRLETEISCNKSEVMLFPSITFDINIHVSLFYSVICLKVISCCELFLF